MPLKLSGYALSYPQLNKLLESTPLEQASEPSDSDAEVLTVWGPIVWFNRWLEKQGMGDKLQAVPVYDPIAAAMAPEGQFHTDRASGTRTPDEHRAQAATGEEAGEPSGVQRSKSKERPTTVEDVDLGEISGQSLLLVRKCVLEERQDSGQRTPANSQPAAGKSTTSGATATALPDEGKLQTVKQEEGRGEGAGAGAMEGGRFQAPAGGAGTCPYGDPKCDGVGLHLPTSQLHHRHSPPPPPPPQTGQARPLSGSQVAILGPPIGGQSTTGNQAPTATESVIVPAAQTTRSAGAKEPSKMIDDIHEEMVIRRWIATNVLCDPTGDVSKVKYVTVENPYIEEI